MRSDPSETTFAPPRPRSRVRFDARPAANPIPAPGRTLRRATTAFVALGLLLRLARYLADFPLWIDEGFLAANFIDPDFGRLGAPLGYGQVCPVGFVALELAAVRLLGFSTWSLRLVPLAAALGSVVLFRHAAGRVVRGLPLLLAVATFSVAWWPVVFAAEVKPYSMDLFVSLALVTLALEWRRDPGRAARLGALAAAAVLAVPLSLPSVFVTGGCVLALGPAAWRTRRSAVWGAWAALAVLPAALFVASMPLYRLSPEVQAMMEDYWSGAFPPLRNPLHLLGWFLEAHTGTMLAYPIGYAWGGSVLTTACVAVGVRAEWARGRRVLPALLLVTLGLCLGASVFHRYPYGDQPRTMQFVAPAVCLLAGRGLAAGLRRLPARPARRAVLGAAVALYVGLAGASLLQDLVRPYKMFRDHRAREFAAWFWESQRVEAEAACARDDLGLVLDPGHWDMHHTRYYRCYRAMFSERHRRGEPLRLDRVSDRRPLRVVFFNEHPEPSPVFRAWLARMAEYWVFRGVRDYTSYGFGPKGLDFANQYVVDEFAPKPGAVALRVPGFDAVAGLDGAVRR